MDLLSQQIQSFCENHEKVVHKFSCVWLVDQGFFFPQFCEVGGLVLIHKRTQPNLARVIEESRKFQKSCYVLLTCQRTYYLNLVIFLLGHQVAKTQHKTKDCGQMGFFASNISKGICCLLPQLTRPPSFKDPLFGIQLVVLWSF